MAIFLGTLLPDYAAAPCDWINLQFCVLQSQFTGVHRAYRPLDSCPVWVIW